jgi:hypothetical protein
MESSINLDELFAEALQEIEESERTYHDAEIRIAFARGRLAQLRIIRQKMEGEHAQTNNPADLDFAPTAVACPCAE